MNKLCRCSACTGFTIHASLSAMMDDREGDGDAIRVVA